MNRRAQRKLAIAVTLGVIGVAAPVIGSMSSASADACVVTAYVDRFDGCVIPYSPEYRTAVHDACSVDYADTCGQLIEPGDEWYEFWHPTPGSAEYECVSTPNPVNHNVCVVVTDGSSPPLCDQQYLPPYQQNVVNFYCVQDPLEP